MSIRTTTRFGFIGLLVGLFAVVALTGYSLQLYVGPIADPNGNKAPHPSLQDAAVDRSEAVQPQDGAEIYMTRCMSCHQMNGRGVPGVFPPLLDSKWVTEDKGVLIRIVLNGMTGEVEVDGEVYSGAMPPWQTFLDDEQTADLLTYIRTSWGNDTTAVTPDEVAAVRKHVTDRKEPWTQEELLQEEHRGIPEE